MAHRRQSRPDFGLAFQVKVSKIFQVYPLRSDASPYDLHVQIPLTTIYVVFNLILRYLPQTKDDPTISLVGIVLIVVSTTPHPTGVPHLQEIAPP